MEKCWYVIIDGATLGPFEQKELLSKQGFNPDTLVWKDGFEGWIPAREVRDLDELFLDPGSKKDEVIIPTVEDIPLDELTDETLVLPQSEPPLLTIWFIIAAIIFIYLIYEVYFTR